MNMLSTFYLYMDIKVSYATNSFTSYKIFLEGSSIKAIITKMSLMFERETPLMIRES